MLKLYKLSEDKYFVLSKDHRVPTDGAYSLNIAIRVLNQCCNIAIEDIEDALLTMNEYDHNIADFGIFGKLTFTEKIDITSTYSN